ncbi:hypothetical protein CC86DRAFT_408477 [Ophiobolus disseminans]|uniref:Uncharacterized protein n=1 Tax=Ophiobolus disseminans TaxID=1469910 RepID=A0A6A6ZUY1_9PLEO|nr:hypothetical protein CC86DRAFT_408477 [Ophiobolus disseminans]
MRYIHISLVITEWGYWAGTRLHGRVEYFVRTMTAHAEDEGKKSLLKRLSVIVEPSPMQYQIMEEYMFALGALCALNPIAEVCIMVVPEWFKKCIEMKVKGLGRDVEVVDWKNKGRGGEKVGVRRKWFQPMLEWKDFAARNGIGLPEGVDRFWAAE